MSVRHAPKVEFQLGRGGWGWGGICDLRLGRRGRGGRLSTSFARKRLRDEQRQQQSRVGANLDRGRLWPHLAREGEGEGVEVRRRCALRHCARCVCACALPHETASSGLAPESEPSNSCPVLTKTA